MNYYPATLESIAKLLRKMDEVDEAATEEYAHVTFAQRVPLIFVGGGSEEVMGYAIDEIGGSWSFEAKE